LLHAERGALVFDVVAGGSGSAVEGAGEWAYRRRVLPGGRPDAPGPRLVGLVADDVTGASDSAVQFATGGWSAHLLLDPDGAPDIGALAPCLLAVATGVRAAGDEAAAVATARAVRSLMTRGCDRLYVKVDSTMRGSVAGQLRGALAAWKLRHPGAIAVLCPAFPGQHRVVVGGRVLVGGLPLAHAAAATDPVAPVRETRVDRLVPSAVTVDLPGLRSAFELRRVGRDGPELVSVDAATDDDLAAIAAELDRLGPAAVAAGSAGLAGALARQWSAGRCLAAAPEVGRCARVLVGVSSLHPVTTESVERLREALAARDDAGRGRVDVVTTPTTRTDAATVAASFGAQMAEQLSRARYDALVLVGGDGAAATLGRIGASAITVHAALARGVPLGRIVGGTASGLRIVTKSGGFGDGDSLVRILDRLQPLCSSRKEQS